MNVTCPYCRRTLDLMELQCEGDLMAIIRMQPLFGRHANLIWAYIELFGITPMKARVKKIRTLLEDMRALCEAEEFSYRKKRYRISRDGVIEALNIVVRRNFECPLNNHNYLKTVMIPISDREGAAAGKKAEEDLREKEARLQRGGRRSDEEQDAGLRHIGDIMKRIG